MLALLQSLPKGDYAPFSYLVSSGDAFSTEKAAAFERTHASRAPSEVLTLTLPRARSVGQRWLSTPWTLGWSFVFCLWYIALVPALFPGNPTWPYVDVILMNGPATCVPIALATRIVRVRRLAYQFLSLPSPRLVYVESFARVRTLSLSARVLRHVVDQFVVQWPSADPKATCYGALV